MNLTRNICSVHGIELWVIQLSILFIIHFAMYGTAWYQLTQSFLNNWESIFISAFLSSSDWKYESLTFAQG